MTGVAKYHSTESPQQNGALMRKAILAIAYILLVIPAGVVIRVLNDPMRRSWSQSQASYWQNAARNEQQRL